LPLKRYDWDLESGMRERKRDSVVVQVTSNQSGNGGLETI
jgi:hypothetical protein